MDFIFWLKLVHTAIFLFASFCIGYVVYCGFYNKSGSFLKISHAVVLSIGIAYVANGFECIISTLVHDIAGRRDDSDIFFPDWFARNIVPVSTVVYLVGVSAIIRNSVMKKRSK